MVETRSGSAASREPAAAKPPLVTVAKIENALRLAAVDRRATALGLRAGMPLADARAMLPELAVAVADEAADLALLARIADWCDRFTPLVALDPPRALLLDITGAAHLFGGEAALLDAVRAGLQRQGFAVRGAIAGNAAAARALARYDDGAIAPPGEDSARIAPLPVEALGLEAEAVHGFRRAGLKTVAQIASRGRAELIARFGAGMVLALDQALGRAAMPITPRLPLPDYRIAQAFAEPVVTQDAILAALEPLAARLAALLETQSAGARRFEAVLFRADGAVHRVAVAAGRPIRAPAVMLRLFREKLDTLAGALDPGFGYDLLRLDAHALERLEAESVGLQAEADAEKEIGFLIDRLATRFGTRRVLRFVPQDTHLPEVAALALPAQGAEKSRAGWTMIRDKGETPRRPLRLFATPEPIEVEAASVEDAPRAFRWRRAAHRIVFAEGPERIALPWWEESAPRRARDYYRIEGEDGRRFWLYREGIAGRETETPRWFVQGLFA